MNSESFCPFDSIFVHLAAGWGADGWIDSLRFYVLFNSISVISGRWDCDMKGRVQCTGVSTFLGFRTT